MVLPTGESPISFSGIRTEFGTAGAESSTAPVRLGQYRRDDSAFTNKDVGGLLNQPTIRCWYTTICCCWF